MTFVMCAHTCYKDDGAQQQGSDARARAGVGVERLVESGIVGEAVTLLVHANGVELVNGIVDSRRGEFETVLKFSLSGHEGR